MGLLFAVPVGIVWFWFSHQEQQRANAIHRQRRRDELVEKQLRHLDRLDALDRQKALAQGTKPPVPVAQNKSTWVDDYKHWRN